METEKIVTKREGYGVNISAGKPDSLRKVVTTFTTVRAYDGQHIGVAGQIGKADDSELYKKAEAALSRDVPRTKNKSTTLKKSSLRKI